MKLENMTYLSLAVGVAFSAAFGTSALAQHTISFSGSATQNTCVAQLNGAGSGGGAVNVGTVKAEQFSSNFSPSAKAPVTFTINLSNCAAGARPYAYFYSPGKVSVGYSNDSVLLNQTVPITGGTGPEHLGLQILLNNDARTPVSFGNTIPSSPPRHSGDPVVTVGSAGTATLTYHARYWRGNGAVTAGSFATDASYVINYD